ncbi:MAG: hypothetical protein ACT4OZ_07030 [Gemmatimonadota bacterium]
MTAEEKFAVSRSLTETAINALRAGILAREPGLAAHEVQERMDRLIRDRHAESR